MPNLTVGIDATNLRQGGGVTHLAELLRALQPTPQGGDRVVVWGGSQTLAALEDRPWLHRRYPPELDRGLLERTLWQRFRLSKVARAEGCHVLFVPGGSYEGDFFPVVTMSRNLLPFEMRELRRYGWCWLTLRMHLLRWIQSRSFRQTAGTIFLTEYARAAVLKVTGELRGQTRVIPHGLNPRFSSVPRAQRAIADYDDKHPYRILYVSIIDLYKHQWQVVEAVAALRHLGLPVALDLVGPAYPPALKRLNEAIGRVDPDRRWVKYHGEVPFNELHERYAHADLGLFASSCENMPNILLETMGSGLPIACSNRGPMLEVLGDTGIYFDPEQPHEIANALRELIDSPQLRARLAQVSHQRAQQFSWQRSARETFELLADVAKAAPLRS